MPGGDRNRIGEFFADELIRHNVLLVGKSNFVATLCKAEWDGKPYALCDIFWLEDGKIVEHWDNAEEVLPADQWVNSGKF